MTNPGVPPTNRPKPDDDQWADVISASGYDDGEPAPAIYLGKRDEAPRARQPSPLAAFNEPGPATRHPGPEPDFGTIFAEPPGPGGPTPSAMWADDDDVVTRAFEEHARAEPAGQLSRQVHYDEPEDAFEGLLGAGGDELLDEAAGSPIEGKSAFGADAQAFAWAEPLHATASHAAASAGWDDAVADGGPVPVGSAVPVWGDDQPEPVVLRSHQPRARTIIREVVETALLALLVFLAVKASFQNFKVDGSSMFPTLENGEFLIVNKLVYSEVDVEKLSRFLPFLDAGDTPERWVFHGPERGEIIVLQRPTQPETDLIKRVIGLPGETVEIINGQVFINGQYLEEPYIKQPWHYTGPKVVIPEGHYFVMGDNRDNSLDSRSGTVGTVPKDNIIGKALITYWPSKKIGLAPNGSPKLTDKPSASTTSGQPPAAAAAR